MLEVYLNKFEEKEKIDGFPWIFNNEVNHFKGNIVNGEVCKVYTSNNDFLCYGLFNSISKIMVRILSFDINEVIDEEFYRRRIKEAINHRLNLKLYETNIF